MTTPLDFVAPDIYFCTVFHCSYSLSIINETRPFTCLCRWIQSCKLVEAFPKNPFQKMFYAKMSVLILLERIAPPLLVNAR